MSDSMLSPEMVQQLVSSMTNQGTTPLTELQVERFLNALTRCQNGVSTGVTRTDDHT